MSDDPDKPVNPFAEMIRHPVARAYLIVSGAALLVLAAALFLFFNSVVGAIFLVLFGSFGVALRWPGGPPLVVLVVVWFTFAPLGLPIDIPSFSQLPGRLPFLDMLLTAVALVHLLAAYRFHSAVRAGMPFDAPAEFVKPGAKPTVRAKEPLRDGELWGLFARAGAVVLGGQLLFQAITRLKVDFRKDFPIGFHASHMAEGGFTEPGELPTGISRVLLAVGAFAALAFAVWFVLWYWRLATYNRDEGRAVSVDQAWAANRRDLNRAEKWRGWMKQKVAGTLPRKGCGAWFLVVGLPLALVALFGLMIVCMGLR